MSAAVLVADSEGTAQQPTTKDSKDAGTQATLPITASHVASTQTDKRRDDDAHRDTKDASQQTDEQGDTAPHRDMDTAVQVVAVAKPKKKKAHKPKEAPPPAAEDEKKPAPPQSDDEKPARKKKKPKEEKETADSDDEKRRRRRKSREDKEEQKAQEMAEEEKPKKKRKKKKKKVESDDDEKEELMKSMRSINKQGTTLSSERNDGRCSKRIVAAALFVKCRKIAVFTATLSFSHVPEMHPCFRR